MFNKSETQQERALTSSALRDAYTDFVLSRQAMLVTNSTLEFYDYTLGGFLNWLEAQNVSRPDDIETHHVRTFLAQLKAEEKTSWTVNGIGRAIRTLLRFWYAEKYMHASINFVLPKVEQKRQPTLSAAQVGTVLNVCNTRDKALILVMVDTGLRRSELLNLNWGDVEMITGLVRVVRGKGGKARSAVIDAATRRALLAYRRTVNAEEACALIQTSSGRRLTGAGLRQIFRRLNNMSGVSFSPHALRRTFVILSLRAGMDVLHLQALLGHAGLEMVKHYAQMVDDDLLEAHRIYSPIDNLSRLK